MNLKNMILLVALAVGLSPGARGQSVVDPQQFPNLENTGKLFSLRVVPKGNNLEISVVGYAVADLQWNNLSLEATYGFGSERQKLVVKKLDDRFIVEKSRVKKMDLLLRSESGREQSFRLNLD